LVSEDIPTPPGGFAVGSRIAGYLLEEQIGRGGMAVVFRAVDERLQRRVALKILAPALAADEAFRQRFVRESRAAAAVDNPHIIPVFEAGEADGVLYIAMRYVPGGDVGSLLRASAPLAVWRVTEIVSQAASALDAAHERGLVHRDIKPANMLLEPAGSRPDYIYLSDFGLSKAMLPSVALTRTGQFLGTPNYMAPEQIEGGPVDGRTDQYSLGCVAYEMLCGSPPFDPDDVMAVIYAHQHQLPPRPSSRVPGLPVALDAVFARVLAKSPADRYGSCLAFADAMRAALSGAAGSTGSADRPAPGHLATEIARPVPPVAGTVIAAGAGQAATQQARVSRPEVPPSRPEVPASQPTEVRPSAQAQPASSAPAIDSHAPGPEPAAGQAHRPWWRSPAAAAAAAAVLVVGLGVGYLVVGRGGGHSPRPDRRGHGGAVTLAAPGCSSAGVSGTTLARTGSKLARISQSPSGVAAAPDGKWVFASTAGSAAGAGSVIAARVGPRLRLTVRRSYLFSSPARGEAITSDGHYLLVATGSGVSVLNVHTFVSGARGAQIGTLPLPRSVGQGGALDVALSSDGNYVFMTPARGSRIAVFNFAKALHSGHLGISDLTGDIPLRSQPTGMAVSPDGKSLYVTSIPGGRGNTVGHLTVLDAKTAEVNPPGAVVGTVSAGCYPSRVTTSANGDVVWVSARDSNYLLAFSAANLRADRGHALIAATRVGQKPVGLIVVNGGGRLVVADSNTGGASAQGYLSVLGIAAAPAGKATLLGSIPTGQTPQDFALVPGTQVMLVTDTGSDQIQLVNLATLP
jgi:DNA-binding beta-propeller fold protein YncE